MQIVISQLSLDFRKMLVNRVRNSEDLKVLGLIVLHRIATNLLVFNSSLNPFLNRIFLSRIKINLLDLIVLDKNNRIQTHSNQRANFRCLKILLTKTKAFLEEITKQNKT